MKYILVILLGCVVTLNKAQSKEVKLTFNIYLDNVKQESDSVYVSITPFKTSLEPIRITNSFVTWVDINKTYSVLITHPRYQKQRFDLDTHNTVKEGTFKVYLKSNEPDCYNGYLKL